MLSIVLLSVLSCLLFALWTNEWCNRVVWQSLVKGAHVTRKRVQLENYKIRARLRDQTIAFADLIERHDVELSEMEDALDITSEAATEAIQEAIEIGEDLYETCRQVTAERDALAIDHETLKTTLAEVRGDRNTLHYSLSLSQKAALFGAERVVELEQLQETLLKEFKGRGRELNRLRKAAGQVTNGRKVRA